ncbi:hypothetical protein [Paenibacillus sp. RUD330]|uniref:hypothetical protein n=1 Tax=Paenibacillus sp. RUD330 TaxID=2023772 RepID=UPI000B92B95D|nr:hypothetical protein [Paenibacillus sp. RUD330]ASS66245.1 hypothetical protein CIC07_08840 [Paenibacillus sp. RUD330]
MDHPIIQQTERYGREEQTSINPYEWLREQKKPQPEIKSLIDFRAPKTPEKVLNDSIYGIQEVLECLQNGDSEGARKRIWLIDMDSLWNTLTGIEKGESA